MTEVEMLAKHHGITTFICMSNVGAKDQLGPWRSTWRGDRGVLARMLLQLDQDVPKHTRLDVTDS